MFKRIMALLIMVFASVLLVACAPKIEGEKIVLITDKGDIDDKSFNQGSYEGVKKFARNRVEYGYLKPEAATNEAYIAAIEQAIADGATVIVTPGYLFEAPINAVQGDYPNVKFIILDGSPANAGEGATIENNVYSVFYAEEQTGFLAGYAAVKEGFRKLGFMGGMAVPAVQRFGHGFVQGAAAAASEIDGCSVTIDYLYTGDFKASPEVQAAAASLYQKGVEVIFACGGAVGQSVMAAAEAAKDKWVIGVDVDQSADSPRVITSSTKELANSVIQALEAIYDTNEWATKFAGKSVVLDVTKDGVGLPMKTSRFKKFKQSDYNKIYDKLVKGTVVVSNVIGEFGDDGTAAKQFETKEVKVNVVPFG
ncbi:MAG: BMP family lipoprotein [Acholeplasmataceae bacterium]|jgi:basic membrane protein A